MQEISLSTSKRNQFVDITSKVEGVVKKSNVKEGICNVFTLHATGAIVVNENYDANICEDTLDALSKLIPAGIWRHDRVDGNGDAHIKASILGPSESIPIRDGKLLLGRWQAISFVELDGPRSDRKVVVSVVSL